MKFVDASAEYLGRRGLTPYQFIERVGRLCYKSEDKIEDGSAEKFVGSLVKSGHTAMIEHSNVILKVDDILYQSLSVMAPYMTKGVLHFTRTPNKINNNIVSGNITSWNHAFKLMELEALKELSDQHIPSYVWRHLLTVRDVLSNALPVVFNYPILDYFTGVELAISSESELEVTLADYPEEIMKHKVHSMKFVCDRGVTHELVRHRNASFAQESTRYCNYGKGKYGSEITVVRPCDNILGDKTFDERFEYLRLWEKAMRSLERVYINMVNNGVSAQAARAVLPNSLKTEIVVTANEIEWQHILDCRLHGKTGKPHPQMVEIMELAQPILHVVSCGRLV